MSYNHVELDDLMKAWVEAQVEDLEEAIMDKETELDNVIQYTEALKHLRWLKYNYWT